MSRNCQIFNITITVTSPCQTMHILQVTSESAINNLPMVVPPVPDAPRAASSSQISPCLSLALTHDSHITNHLYANHTNTKSIFSTALSITRDVRLSYRETEE